MNSKKTQASKIYVTDHSKGTYTRYGLCTKPKFITILWLMMLTTLSAWGQVDFGGGSGTIGDPYRINHIYHLEQLARDVNNGNTFKGKYFALQRNMDLNGATLTPIGGKEYTDYNSQNEPTTGERRFCGIFLGNNYTIQNFQINTDKDFFYTGLFGYLGEGATVYDLTIDNATIKAQAYCGGIAGIVDSKASIWNCQVGAGVEISADPNQLGTQQNPNQCFGGITGVNRGTINSCTSKATVTSGTSNYANSFGGIVGYNNGKIINCNSIAQVVGTTSMGAIAGSSGSNATYSNNYYHCFAGNTPLGAVDGVAVNGNTWMYTVNFATGVSGILPGGAILTDGSTSYFAAGKVVFMTPSYQAEDGYVANNDAVTFYANGTPLTAHPSGELQFTMPAEDVVITATCTEQKRDIGYADWVKVSIPEQTSTGSALTPVITVTDTKDGGSTVLSEGTHYTVTLPGEMTDVGNYSIILTGIGDFAGTRTEQFSITTSSPWQGKGTAGSPYLITTTDEMNAIATEMPDDGYEGVYFRLEADLPIFQTSTVIGTVNKLFNGTFDGNGHSININLSAADEFYRGLFGVVGNDGKVMNLTLDGSVNGRTYVGGIAGMNYGTIENCIFHGSVKGTSTYSGGIVGYNYGTVRNCLSTGNIESNMYAGGIAGYSDYGGTLSGNLVIGATVKSISNHQGVGAIASHADIQRATSNYYYNCTVGGVANATNVGFIYGDKDGARSIHVLTLADGIIATGETITYDNQLYAASNTEVTLSTSAGYPVSDITSSDVTISENNTFTMPVQDVTISATSTPLTTLNLTANEATLNGVTKYWTTFYHPALSYALPAGAMALYMKEDMALYMLGDGDVVPAGTPVIIMGDTSSISITKLDSTSVTNPTDNKLSGTAVTTAASSLTTGGKKVYVMSKVNETLGFYEFSGTTIPANKAYYVDD